MERIIDGYRFSTDEDALMAKEELQRVNYISEKLKLIGFSFRFICKALS